MSNVNVRNNRHACGQQVVITFISVVVHLDGRSKVW